MFKINWDSPLSSGLLIYTPILSSTVLDYVSERIATPADVITNVRPSINGMGIADANQSAGGYNIPGGSDIVNGLPEFTIIATARINSLRTGGTDETNFVRISAPKGRGVALAYMEKTKKCRFLFYTSGTSSWTAAYDTPYTLDLGEMYTTALSYSSISGVAKWYIAKLGENLELIRTITGLSGNLVIETPSISDYRLSGGAHTFAIGQSNFLDHKFYKKELTHDAINRLNKNLGAILKPARTVANDAIYSALFATSSATTLIHDIATVQFSGLDFTCSTDTNFQPAETVVNGFEFYVDNNVQSDITHSSALGLEFELQQTIIIDTASVTASGIQYGASSNALFDVGSINQTGLDFYSSANLQYDVSSISVSGIGFASGIEGESWSVGAGTVLGVQFSSNKTIGFNQSSVLHDGIDFKINKIADFSISFIESLGLNYHTNNTSNFSIGSITHIGLGYTSFIGQSFGVATIENYGLDFSATRNINFSLSFIDTSWLEFNIDQSILTVTSNVTLLAKNKSFELYEKNKLVILR